MVYLTNLAAVLRDAGLTVHEVSGWQTRGRPASTGSFDPVGVLCHHTATKASTSDKDVIDLLVRGRSDLPGPLCQLGLGRDGTVHVVAAGRANHAGEARSSGTVAAGDGNRLYIAIEAFNDGVGEPWPQVQYEAYVKLAAVLSVKITGNSVNTVRGHKETSVTGKIDPTFDMDQFRSRVQDEMRALTAPPPPPPPVEQRDVQLVFAGDWNEVPASRGRYSPHWIARKGGLTLPEDWHTIDYPMSSAPLSNVRKIPGSKGPDQSDHAMVAFDVTNPADGRVLHCATWNVERDRRGNRLLAMLTFLRETCAREELDVVALQEVKQYHSILGGIVGYRLVAATDPNGVEHNALLVRDGVPLTHIHPRLTSKIGWVTVTGANHDPSSIVLATVDGWLRFGAVHEAPTVDWVDKKPVGPSQRILVRVASARSLVKIARRGEDDQ